MADVGIETEATATADAPPAGGRDNPSTSANSEIRKIGRHTLVYAAGVSISKLAGLLMLPVYTRALTPSDYGVLELLSMTIDLIGTIVGVGIASSVFKFHADASGQAEKRTVVSTAALAVLALSAVTAFIGLFISAPLTETILGGSGRTVYFQLFFLIYFLQNASAIPLLLLRVQHRSKTFVAVNVAKLVGTLSLNIYLVVVLKLGVMGVLISSLIVELAAGAALSVYLFRTVGFHFSSHKFNRMVAFGYPLALWFLANFLVVFSNRYFINHYVGPAAVGIYSLAAKFAFVITAFAFMPFQMIWDPQRFAIAKRPDAVQIYRRVFFYLNLALGTVALGIALFVFDVIRIIADPAFRGAQDVVPLLLAAQIIFHWTAFANIGLFLRNRTHVLAIVAGNGVVAVLVLNYLLVPRFGVLGAALAAIIAYVVRFVAVYLVSQREYRVDYPWAAVARLYAIVVAAVIIRELANPLTLGVSVSVSVVLALVSLTAIYRYVLTDLERGLVRRYAARPRNILSLGGA